jgi:hypothetical protein
MDANFKLKQKERGFSDPPLSNGLAYMIPNDRLQEHLAQCADKDLTTEVSTLGLWSSLIGVDFLPVRSILAVRLSMQSARLIRSMPRDMRSLALVGLIAPDMASSDRMASLTYNEANGKSHTHGSLVAMKLIGIISYLNMDLALLSTLLPSLTAGISRVRHHWGQGPKYPLGTLGTHCDYRQNVITMCPGIKSWVTFKMCAAK